MLILRRSGLIIILLVYVALAGMHSLIVPLTTGNDEWAHFLYVRFIAENGRLPATLAEREAAGYKSDAPALYHLIVVGLAAPVEPIRLLRPLDSPRRFIADNVVDSYALVHTAVEQWPFRGEVLIWYLGRLGSIIFGLVLIWLTYLTSLSIFPTDTQRALLSAALLAFIPGVIFHSSVLTYESLSAALTALFLLIGLRCLQQPHRARWWLLLGVLTGLSITTKYSAILLLLEIIFIAWLAKHRAGAAREQGSDEQLTINNEQLTDDRPQVTTHMLPSSNPPTLQPSNPPTFQPSSLPFFQTITLAALAALFTSAWWFGFVSWHFNTIDTQGPIAGLLQPLLVGDASDTTSVQVASFLFGGESVGDIARPPQSRNYLQLLTDFLQSFWAAPVTGRFTPVLPFIYSALALLGLVGLWRAWRQAGVWTRTVLLLLLVHAGLIVPILLIRLVLAYDPREVAQGRHVLLPAASAISLLLVWGWDQWSRKLVWVAVAGLLLWSVLGQVGWAAIAYPRPIQVWSEPVPAPKIDRSKYPGKLIDSLELIDAAWEQQDNTLAVTLWWRALDFSKEDYLVELKLLGPAGQVVGFAAGHPAQGRYPTRAWEPGDIIRDTYLLPLIAFKAGEYPLRLSLLDRQAQPVTESSLALGSVSLAKVTPSEACATWPHREPPWLSRPLRPNASLTLVAAEVPKLHTGAGELQPWRSDGNFHTFVVGPDWPAVADLLVAEEDCGSLTFDVPPRSFTPPDIARPLLANFNNEIELLGYELPTRRVKPGQRLPLTLYYRGLTYMGEDYRLFANPLDTEQQRWGGYDRRPRDGYSTLRWVPGEVITDPFGIPIDPDAPEGIYQIDLGFYREIAGGAESLPLVQAGQPLDQRSLRLDPIKVGGPPPGVVIPQAEPQVTVSQSFAGQITLLGYDLQLDQPLATAAPVDQQPTPSHPSNPPLLPPSTLHLTLFWRADTLPAADYTVFRHLRSASNQNVTQQDGLPANGRYPTGLWDTGEIIQDDISLDLSQLPPGRYTLVVGLYNAATLERLPTPGNPTNEVALEPIEIP